MGSGQSARRLTISNEEEVGVIKVSNAVVQRLAQGEAAKINESSSNAKYNTTNHHSAVSNIPMMAPQSEVQPIYYSDITMSALRIQQQKEKELMQQEQYWQKRMQHLKEGYQKIEHILEEEYKKAVNETSNTQIGQEIADAQGTIQPSLQNKVLKCFQDHPKEILRCSSLVKEFSNCIWNMHYTHVIKTHS